MSEKNCIHCGIINPNYSNKYCEDCEERKPKTKKMGFELTETEHQILQKHKIETGESYGATCRKALFYYFTQIGRI